MQQPISASAPGKLILCGEHAVVYHRPAIALPLADLRATVSIAPNNSSGAFVFTAPDLNREWSLASQPNEPLSLLTLETLHVLGIARAPALRVTITSTIPVASGMGSGAAVATALVRTLAAYVEQTVPDNQVSALVYENERRLHGTPSGIDNTVIVFNRAIWFKRLDAAPLIEPVTIVEPLALLIADTGVRSPTHAPVGEVRRRWQADPAHYNELFDQVESLVHAVRIALAAGIGRAIGALLNHNHTLLQEIGVSSPELDRLVEAAQRAGALGAKLSGAGWGGVMLALVTPQTAAHVTEALHSAGATHVFATTVPRS